MPHTAIFWLLALVVLLILLWLNQTRALPDLSEKGIVANGFKVDKAMQHVKELARSPRIAGSAPHRAALSYLRKQLEKLGFSTELQTTTGSDGWKAQPVTNLLGRLPANGTSPGKSLLLMAHYDSVSLSPGVSDDASGVAAVLESLRAWLANNPQQRRDVLVLFSDGEENGLLGARAFVNKHPWAQDIGLAINLEARGSGGPAYLLLETRHGNQRLVQQLAKAGLPRPNSSSLAYSVYQWLPNDTDLSVLHQGQADIDGYNIAFIGDPFDYHTPLDRRERLDRASLAHQGETLLPLLRHFAGVAELTTRSEADEIFFTVPLWQGLVHFPQQWVKPLAMAIGVGAVLLIAWGWRSGCLSATIMASAFLPLVQSLVLAVLLGRYGWKMVMWLNPHFADMALGFPYSGRLWTAFFLNLSLCLSLWLWWRWYRARVNQYPHPAEETTVTLASGLAAALLHWLLVATALTLVLPGAAFLWALPLALSGLLLAALLNKQNPVLWLLLVLLPFVLVVPLLWQLPQALGLDALFVVCALVSFMAPLGLPLLVGLGAAASRWFLRSLCTLSLLLFFWAQWQSGITPRQPQQNSLFYLQDSDNRNAWWLSLDRHNDPWKQAIMGQEYLRGNALQGVDSRYGPWLTQASSAPFVDIPGFAIQTRRFAKTGTNHYALALQLTPLRPVHRLDLVTGVDMTIERLKVNGEQLALPAAKKTQAANNKAAGNGHRRANQSVVRYWLTDQTPVVIELAFSSQKPPYFLLYGYSPDLLENPWTNVPPRPDTLSSRPSSLTDRLITRQKVPLGE